LAVTLKLDANYNAYAMATSTRASALAHPLYAIFMFCRLRFLYQKLRVWGSVCDHACFAHETCYCTSSFIICLACQVLVFLLCLVSQGISSESLLSSAVARRRQMRWLAGLCASCMCGILCLCCILNFLLGSVLNLPESRAG
jgi:hypothetical protein